MRAAAAIVAFYVFLALAVLGFGAAGPTAGAPWAVVTGTLGLLGTLAAIVARIDGESGPTGHGRRLRWRR